MSKKVRTHKFNGIKYVIDIEKFVGSYTPPKLGMPEIALPNGLGFGNSKKARDDLLNLLHEVRHAQDFGLSESTVDRESKEIRNLLWRLGYRRTR